MRVEFMHAQKPGEKWTLLPWRRDHVHIAQVTSVLVETKYRGKSLYIAGIMILQEEVNNNTDEQLQDLVQLHMDVACADLRYRIDYRWVKEVRKRRIARMFARRKINLNERKKVEAEARALHKKIASGELVGVPW